MNKLDSLKKFTNIVADSGNIELIRQYSPRDATTNPSIILQAVFLKHYNHLIDQAIVYAKKKGGDYKKKINNACDKILVNIGIEILKYIPGFVSTEIDARLSFNKDRCISKAKKLIKIYEEEGIDRSKVLIKLASTWESIQAAQELEKNKIHCNLTLLFSFAQAKACAEAGVFLISPFVGRIYDWYCSRKLIKFPLSIEDPGVTAVKKIYKYYKQHQYQTIIMGASFRNIEQILSLSGCDCLTISPILLKELQSSKGIVERQLFPPKNTTFHKSEVLSEAEFRWQHNQDPMAVEKLSEGIRQFGYDQEKLEKMLALKIY